MRIVSGEYKGRRIPVPKKMDLRPTTGFAKEGLFNILNNTIDFHGLKVLDCFFGTGSISIEFISRGADEVTSVDKNRDSYRLLNKVAEEWDIDGLDIVRSDVFIHLEQEYRTYDIIFADPPFKLEGILDIPTLVFKNELLNENGMLIVEHSKETDFSNSPYFSSVRKFGSVNFSFFEK